MCIGIKSLTLINYLTRLVLSYHHRNIWMLAIKIFKFLNGISQFSINEVFQAKSSAPYYLRYKNELYSKKQWCVVLSQSRRWHPKSGHLPLRKWKTVNLHILSKEGIRKWKPSCPCWLCKTYLQHVGPL